MAVSDLIQTTASSVAVAGVGPRYRVGLVGAGGISAAHLEALQAIPEAEVVAIADRTVARAEVLARQAGISRICGDVWELADKRICDAAHVLVPPDLHRSVAEPLLAAGVHVLLEKPLATTREDCQVLIETARRGGALLGVNQNLLFNRAYLNLKRVLASGEIGGLQHLVLVWSVPLAALSGQRFGHWMFQEPQNILLEQAVHPFSQILDLGGRALAVRSLPGGAIELASGRRFYRTWQISLELERCTAQVFLSFGQPFRTTSLTAVCDHGLARANLENNHLAVERRSHFSPPFDSFWDGLAEAQALVRQGLSDLTGGILAGLKLRPTCEPLPLSMRGSLQAFYAGLGAGRLPVAGDFGAELVALCEDVAQGVMAPPASEAAPALPLTDGSGPCDVAVFGGAGLIGRHVLRRLLRESSTVRVLVRSTKGLPDLFREPGVQVVQGDAECEDVVDRMVRGARTVVDLVYPKEGVHIDRRMAEGAGRVAESCLRHGVERFVYVSSIAALFLDRPGEVITGGTACDSRPRQRSEYSRGKAASEQLLLELHRERGLPVSILRPGIVVGEGGQPFHSGLGQFIHQQHCLGWGPGTAPLPFVLVEDVAASICLALRSEVAVGRIYNVVGEVRLTAREYIAELASAMERPLRFHPRRAFGIQAFEIAKWMIKRLAGRRDVQLPSYRQLRSQGMRARFDCADIQQDLGWRSVADQAEFVRRAIAIHARRSPG